MRNYGDTPHLTLGAFSNWREIFISEPERALTHQVQIAAGYGTLPAGTVLAKNLSAGGNSGLFVPYNPTTFNGGDPQPGKAFLVADSGTGGSDLYVTTEDSYKFIVGDDLIVNSTAESAQNLGAITAIDRTTETHRAKITVTETVTNDMKASEYAYVCVEAGDNTNNYSDAVGVLMQDVEAGTGAKAKGAFAPLILSNALLYEGALFLFDAAAKTDLSASSFGEALLMK